MQNRKNVILSKALVYLSTLLFFMFSTSLYAASPLSACPAQKLQAQKSLAQLKQQWVYVDFWASWCGPCRKTFPFMNELQKKYQDKLSIAAISIDENPGTAKQFLKRYPANFPTYVDPSSICPQVFNVKGMPTSYLISPQGQIVFTEEGFSQGSREKIFKAVDQALGL